MKSRMAFTLIELLTVVVIVSILIALVVPSVQSAREAGRRIQCSNNIRQVNLSVQLFESARKRLPENRFNLFPGNPLYSQDITISRELLPYLEHGNLSDQFRLTATTFAEQHFEIYTQQLSIFQCPSQESNLFIEREFSMRFNDGQEPKRENLPTSDYVFSHGVGRQAVVYEPLPGRFAVSGSFGAQCDSISNGVERSSEILDGLSNTISIWESMGSAVFLRDSQRRLLRATPSQLTFVRTQIHFQSGDGVFPDFPTMHSYFYSWAGLRPGYLATVTDTGQFVNLDNERSKRIINVTNRSLLPFSFHPSVSNFGMMDGSVTPISENIENLALFNMATRSRNY